MLGMLVTSRTKIITATVAHKAMSHISLDWFETNIHMATRYVVGPLIFLKKLIVCVFFWCEEGISLPVDSVEVYQLKH